MTEDKFINMLHSYHEPGVIVTCEVEDIGYFVKMTKSITDTIRFGDFREISFIELDNFNEEDVYDLLEDMAKTIGSF